MKTKNLIKKHNDNFSTYYMGELYSHTPMALIALRELGASEERLDEFYHIDTQKLEPINTEKDLIEITDENWKDYLGQFELESSYIKYFRELVHRDGINMVISQHFDFLMKGVGAAAFHPIIRLSYAMIDNHADEVAISLATWAASFLDLGVDSKLEGHKSLFEVLGEFQKRNFHNGEKFKTNMIAFKMQQAAKTKDFQELNSVISAKELEAQNLEKSLLWLFSQTNNFTILHAVTSHHAFESLIDFASNKDEARVYFWKAVLAAYLSTIGTMSADFEWEYPRLDNLLSWREITQTAILSNDDHVIKLVHILSIKNREQLDIELRYACSLKLGVDLSPCLR